MMRPTHLDAEVASIDIVAEKEIASFCWVAADLEQLHEIKVLTMHITTDSNRGIHFQEIGFALQNFGPLLYDEQSLLFGEATLAIEMLLEELEVWLVAMMGGSELVMGGWMNGRSLNI